ncbi:MAG: M48 family metallopeptidase [Desulfotalea sp.]
MSFWLITISSFILFTWLLESYLTVINLRAQPEQLPKYFEDIYNVNKYKKSLNYNRETTNLSLLSNAISTIITLSMLFLGGFNYLDQLARGYNQGEIVTGLIFFSLISLVYGLISMPFSIYSTFVIEERYGFNRTTIKTFIVDSIKGISLTVILGGGLLATVLWFFLISGPLAWIYCWLATIIFSFVMQILAPVIIMPMFNKFTPIEDDSLRDKIGQYANKQGFKLNGIFIMDSSKRSAKLNAFFTGFGKFRKVVLFDTLVEKLSKDEILAVLAHEIGHAKLKHMLKGLMVSIIQTGLIFFLLSLIIKNTSFTLSLMGNYSIYASLFFFAYLLSPTNFVISYFSNQLSRKNEYEADEYAAKTTGESKFLVAALKKLAGENMANLSPHPLYVKVYYSHPPLRDRFAFLNNIDTKKV